MGRLKGRKRWQRKGPWWERKIEEHPFRTLSLVILSIGGVLLLMFFAQLGELPEIDLTASTSILAAVALMGILVGLVFGGTTGMAGVMYLNVERDHEWLRTPLNLGLAAIPGLVLLILFVVQVLVTPGLLPAANVFALCVGLSLLIGYSRVEHLISAKAFRLKEARGLPFHGAALVFAGYSIMWAMFVATGIMCLIAMLPSQTGTFEAVMTLIAWGVFSISLSVMFAKSQKRGQIRRFLGLAMIALMGLIALTRNYTGLAVAAVRAVGLGEVPVRLVLTERGCQIVNAASTVPVCHLNEREKVGVICPAILKSKIGTPFLIAVAPFNEDESWPSLNAPAPIPVAKVEVLSWPRIKTLKGSPVSSSAMQGKDKLSAIATIEQRAGLSKHQQVWLDEQCGRPTL